MAQQRVPDSTAARFIRYHKKIKKQWLRGKPIKMTYLLMLKARQLGFSLPCGYCLLKRRLKKGVV